MSRRAVIGARAACDRIAVVIENVNRAGTVDGRWRLRKGDAKTCEHVLLVLAKLTDDCLEELERKGRFTTTADGFPTSLGVNVAPLVHSGGRGGLRTNPTDPIGRKRGHGHASTTSVESAAQAREHGHPDPTGQALRSIFRTIAEMDDVAAVIDSMIGTEGWEKAIRSDMDRLLAKSKTVDRALGFVEYVKEKQAGRQSSLSGPCQACERAVTGDRDDRMRSGYCMACYKAWRRAGSPDRPAWERTRRASLEEKAS